ncbi:hypothetical protein [Halarcobacter ebronensis]|uniref:Uncharacterized protein n=1 Tax=Halarcobacter ebronensis TaxID=1462615 RepID=A0A4Q1API5_9BACT|nr:hypothetical protein [Halarcobacter ebronensis]QKF80726.1 hypothetical protein AEBR_0210 [Halarcobacter ebronensis]RXK08519.1 hypothetical protein CRV07_01595 [Halarcobacter ebronensis]
MKRINIQTSVGCGKLYEVKENTPKPTDRSEGGSDWQESLNIKSLYAEKLSALKTVYAKLDENLEIELSNKEVITPWQINDIKNVKDLEELYTDEEILMIYDSGL